MEILVVGATGMTGQPLVEQLLESGHQVRAIVRSPQKLTLAVQGHKNLTIIKAAILDISDNELVRHVKGCDAVVSCLGHVVDFNGMFGHPRKLCTQAVARLCQAIEANKPTSPVKFILMNSVGVKNPERVEKRMWFERVVLGLLKGLPPHRDNETALEFLYENLSNDNRFVEWSIVRPDSLINAPVSSYEINPSPSTGLFSGRPTSRANVANFMKALIEDAKLWGKWKFDAPVIMDAKGRCNRRAIFPVLQALRQ